MTKCPNCGSDRIDRDEVDIGVGTQCGPWSCHDCGWTEGQPTDDVIIQATTENEDGPETKDREDTRHE